MTLGLVGRCDTGGLAALTREVHRHLHPARTLLVDVPDARRGDCTPDEYLHGQTYRTEFRGAFAEDAIDWAAAEGIDTLWSAETFYDDRLVRRAHQAGIRTVVYAMPELAPWYVDDTAIVPRLVTTPTWWRLDKMPNAQVLPFPVARDRLPYDDRWRRPGDSLHLFHPVGTPFYDRNGTQILLDALPFITAPEVRLTLHAARHVEIPKCDIDVQVVRAEDGVDGGISLPDYWDVYPPNIDLLVLPRRYGGLSLPVQECASLGVPALMLQTDPYAIEPFVTSIPSTGSRPERMKGAPRDGIPVHSADPRVLATAIDFLARNGVHAESRAANAWAEAHAWTGPLGDRWHTILDPT